MKAIELTTTEFQKRIYDFRANPEWKYEGDLPAVIDFYAPWCGPCRMMGPVMESLAEEYAGKVRIYKVNVDKEKRLAAIFRVRSIPTFLFIPMSGEPKHANGAMEIAHMRRIIDTTEAVHGRKDTRYEDMLLAFYDFAEGGGSSRLRPLCIKPPPCCDGCRSDAGPVLANASRSPFTHMPAVGTSVCGILVAGNGRYALK